MQAPEGWHTITPRIVARDAVQFVEFLRVVFGARGDLRQTAPYELAMGDSKILVSEAGERNPMSAFLYVYVQDVDATPQRAISSGVWTLEKPFDTPYGDRRCMVEDKWGNTWQIAARGDKDSAA